MLSQNKLVRQMRSGSVPCPFPRVRQVGNLMAMMDGLQKSKDVKHMEEKRHIILCLHCIIFLCGECFAGWQLAVYLAVGLLIGG